MTLPFYDLFCAVRARFGLTISDYTALLQALELSLKNYRGIWLMEELVTLCQLLWAKTPEASEEIAAAVRSHALHAVQEYQQQLIDKTGELAEHIQSRHELEALVAAWMRREESLPQPSSVPDEQPVAEAQSVAEPQRDLPTPPAPDTPAPTEKPLDDGVSISSTEMPSLETYEKLVAVAAEAQAVTSDYRIQPQVFARPPEKYRVLPRRIRHLWRLYRLPRRSGANTVFSLPDTIASIERHGGLPIPIYKPHLNNEARVLLLIDVGRYMDAFLRDVEVLVTTFLDSAFHRRQIVYFDGCPEHVPDVGDELGRWELYTDKALEKPIRLADLRASLGRSGVLIVSDAGAAGNQRQMRQYINTMNAFITTLKATGSRVVWLNPRSEERWPNTAAERLRKKLHMHPYTTRGLEKVVNELRGFVIA